MFPRHVDLLMAASLSAFAISATPSHAADEQQAQRVSYADLDLDIQAGARTLGMGLDGGASLRANRDR